MIEPRAGLRRAAFAVTLLAATPAAAAGGLEIIPDGPTLVVLIAVFLALIPVVNNVLLKPLLGVLDEREERIHGSRRRAEQLGSDADAIVSRYEGAVRDVQVESEAERERAISAARNEEATQVRSAREDAERRIEAARAEIATSLDAALPTLRENARALASEAATRVLGRPL